MRDWIIFFAVIAGVVFGVTKCTETEWYQAPIRERHAQEEANRVPRIVSRSTDGCAVYAFNPGDRWRYFTRCGTQVTTDNNYTVTRSSGKTSTTETVEDSITTEHK